MKNQASDLPIRIKNGYLAQKQSIVVDSTNMTRVILELLKSEGYIGAYTQKGEGVNTYIEVDLVYKNKMPALTGVKIISKPGRRVYESTKAIKPVLGGLGIAIVSTPAGMLTDKQAREKKVGGEVLFYMW